MRWRRLRALLAAATGAALLVGCSAVPMKKADLEVSKLSADHTQVDQTYRNYEKARAAAFTALDADILTLVETGSVLAIDAGAIDVAKRLHGSASTGTDVEGAEVEHVYTPRLGEYPLWFVAIARDAVRNVRRVQVFERESSTERWELVSTPQAVLDAVLPVPSTTAGAAENLDPDSSDGLKMSPSDAIATYAAALADPESQEASAVVSDDSFATQMRLQEGALARPGTTFDRTWDAQPVKYALRTEDGGALVFGTLMRQDGWVLTPGATVRWPAESDQRAYFGDPMSGSGVLRYYHQVLMYVPPPTGSGNPRVLGQYGGVIGAEDTGTGASASEGLPLDSTPQAPDGTAPDGTAPDGTAPDGTAPDGTAPDGTLPAPTSGPTPPTSGATPDRAPSLELPPTPSVAP